jgi:hypothetical protein
LVSASLELVVNGKELTLHRHRKSGMVVAAWSENTEQLQLTVPAREARGEVLPDTGVEVLSDLIFYLADVEPPRVRRRKGSPEEHLERLSFRDLFEFCYLDQESMDSSFFKLNSENYASKRKSVDTLRYLLGYKQEQLAQLESQLQTVREERLARAAGSEALGKALSEAGFEDVLAIDQHIEEMMGAVDAARRKAQEARKNRGPIPHAVEELRILARGLASEVASNEDSLSELDARIDELTRHDNELKMLSVRFQRTAAARTILGGVDFINCPRCTQKLPDRDARLCPVCGQPDHVTEGDDSLKEDVVSSDLRARQVELGDALTRMRAQKRRLGLRASELVQEKAQVEAALSSQLHEYDSAFLSQAVENERVVATLEQKLNSLLHNRKLPDVLEEQKELVQQLYGQEAELRSKLIALRETTFRDARNIERLESLFLDCLLKVKFPDVKSTYRVLIDPSSFDPQIMMSDAGDFIALSFANAGSGGMKSLFKTCFALAVHRLCAEIGSQLPNLLIIDTATKNVSSIENPETVNAFYAFVYELSATELSETQFIIVDNEYTAPPQKFEKMVTARHMMNGSSEYPPLVPYLLSMQAIDDGSDEEEGPD